MSTPKRTGRRAAAKLATTSHPSASSAFLPRRATTRAMRRGRQRPTGVTSADATANFGAVLEFNQPNGSAEIDYNPAGISTNSATFEVWIKTTVKTQQMLFETAYTQPFIFMENDQIGVIWVGANADPNYVWLSADTRPISDGEWHHIAVAFNNGAITFYKDGLPTADALSVSTPAGGNHPVYMGTTWAGIPSFIGQMWNIKIWHAALTASDIQLDMYIGSYPYGYPNLLTLFSALNVATNTFTNPIYEATAALTNANVTWDALPQPPTFAFEIPGGGNDYVDIGGLTAPVNSTASTFECWIKMSTAPGVSTTRQTILLCRGGDPSGASPRIEYDGGDTLGVFWNTPGAYSTDTTPISDGAWHHIAVVFNNNQLTFLKDGLPTNETFTLPATQASGGDLQLGPALGNTQSFNGLITDVRVWSVARSIGDIQSFMYATLTGTESGLVGLNNLSYYRGANTIKNQVNGDPGSINGNAKVIETVGPQSQQPVPQSIWTYPISGIAPLGPKVSPKGLIYAENVAASNNGPAGNYLRSLDLQDHTLNWTYSVHDNSAIPTPVIPAAVGVGNTVAYVAAQATNTAGSNSVELHAMDYTTGQAVWDKPAQLDAINVVTKPVESDNLVVMGANVKGDLNLNALFWVDTASGKTVKSLASLFPAGEFMSDPLVGTITINNTPTQVAYVALSYPSGDITSAVWCVSLTDSNFIWVITPSHSVSGNMAMDRDRLYVACQDGAVMAMNLADGTLAWIVTKTNLPINSKPVVIGSAVYVGSTDGNLYAFDSATGNDLWQLNVGSAISTDLITEDGAIYFATQGNGAELPPTFFSVDAASQGNDVLIYPVPDADTILFDQGQSNGVVYFYGRQNVYAVNMDMILHEFNVDTKLIVEDYDTTADPSNPNSQAIGNDTSYRLTLSLFDPLKVPRISQAVKVWASGPLYLANMTDPQGTRLQIGPNQPLWVQTDGSGQVTLAVSAYDDGSHGGTGGTADNPTTPLVSCPAVYAWANFMMPGEAIVIYPDHEHIGNLSQVQGQSAGAGGAQQATSAKAPSGRLATDDTLTLNTATGYDGKPLVQSQYQDSTSLTIIATTIRNTIGTRNPASVGAPSLAASAAGKYIAYPASMPNVNYASDNTEPTTRPFVPGGDPTFTLDLSSGKPTYQPGVFDTSAPPTYVGRASASPQSVETILSIGSFFKNVVKGTEQVAKLAWQFAQNAVNTVIHTAEGIYQLTITSLEDAVTLVVGFLKSVVADVRKLIEWLSALFNWGDILANHTLLKQQISNPNDPNNPGMVDRLQSWLTTQINLINSNQASDIDTAYGALAGKGQSSVSSMASQTAGTTVQSVQGQNSNPNNVYNYSPDGSPQNNSSQCQWMHQKTTENSANVTLGPPPYLHYLPWIAAGGAPAGAHSRAGVAAAPSGASGLASSPDPNTLSGIFDKFISTLLKTIETDFADFPAQVKAKASIIGNKLSSSKSILSTGLADIMAVFETLADDVIEIGKDIAAAFLEMVNALLSQLVSWLNTTINIPFVSALYKLITHGDDLTILDAAALIVAVPTTVLMKAISGAATPFAYVAARAEARVAGILSTDAADIDVGKLFSGIAASLVSLVTAFYDARLLELQIPFNGNRSDVRLRLPTWVDFAMDFIGWGLGMVENFVWKKNSWEAQDWVFWVIQAWPLGIGFVFNWVPSTLTAQAFRDFMYGFIFLMVAMMYAALWPQDYKNAHGAKGLVFTANVFTSLNSMIEIELQPSQESDSDGISIIVAIYGKMVFGVVSAVLSFSAFVDTLVHPPSSSQRSGQHVIADHSVAPALA